MGNVNMEARQIHYRGGEKPMSVEEAIKEAGSTYVLPIASAETLGGIKVGSNLTINSETGELSGAAPYVLPAASDETLGGVKVGDNLSIDENGVLSASGGSINYSTNEQNTGRKWIDGKDIYERTYILREDGADQYTKGGISNSEYLIGLENVENVWVDKIQAFRTSSGSNIVDSRNISGEIITSFDRTTGGLYYYTTHTPSDIIVVLQYTKAATP